jgi:hypothetical protein
MINKDPMVTDTGNNLHLIHRICWSAIFAGAFVGLGLGFLLQLYGTAISLSAYSSTPQGASVIALGGLIGMIIGVIAAMATAGFVAGYLGRFHYYPLHGGIIYGFVTWSLILFLSAVITVPMGHFVSTYENTLTRATVVVGSNVDDTKVSNDNNTNAVKHHKVTTDEPVTVSANKLAWGGWTMFILFFIGAISSCVGASYGMKCKREYILN